MAQSVSHHQQIQYQQPASPTGVCLEWQAARGEDWQEPTEASQACQALWIQTEQVTCEQRCSQEQVRIQSPHLILEASQEQSSLQEQQRQDEPGRVQEEQGEQQRCQADWAAIIADGAGVPAMVIQEYEDAGWDVWRSLFGDIGVAEEDEACYMVEERGWEMAMHDDWLAESVPCVTL